MSRIEPGYDVVVVGARAAGAATAYLLARHGLRVLLVDRSRYGTDTLSTHALMRGGVLQLTRWGLLDADHRRGHSGGAANDIPVRRRPGADHPQGVVRRARPCTRRGARSSTRSWSTRPRRPVPTCGSASP